MGHYYAEMCCDVCGRIRCTCPPRKVPPDNRWLVDSDYNVVRAEEHKKDHPYFFLNPLFDKKEDAEIHRVERILDDLKKAKARVLFLKQLLNAERRIAIMNTPEQS